VAAPSKDPPWNPATTLILDSPENLPRRLDSQDFATTLPPAHGIRHFGNPVEGFLLDRPEAML